MNYSLSKEISRYLFDKMDVITLASGIVDTFNLDGVKYPAAKTFCTNTDCEDEYKEMSPNDKEACIVFFRTGSYRAVRENRNTDRISTQLKMHVWINKNRIDSCEPSDVVQSIIHNLPRIFKSDLIVNSVLKSYDKSESDPYKGYKFAKDIVYKDHPYYGCVISLNYDLVAKCALPVKTVDQC